jgi:hypothetical protein
MTLQEAAMRTRTRQVVRMLADMRHAAHCRALRYTATQEAMRLAENEADADAAQSPEASEATSDPHSIDTVKRSPDLH